MTLKSLIAAALLSLAATSQAGLIHQYELNGDLADALGGTALKSLGGAQGANGYAFDANRGLQLQFALGSVYTIDMVFQLAHDKRSYQRLLNFQHTTADNGLYATSNQFCFYIHGCTKAGSFAPSQDIRLTVTRDSAARVTFYQNGVSLFSFDDSVGLHTDLADVMDPADPNKLVRTRWLSFFKDDGAGEAATGTVDFIHLYDNALSQQEVAALNVADVPEPASLILVGAGLGLLGLTRRRKPGASA